MTGNILFDLHPHTPDASTTSSGLAMINGVGSGSINPLCPSLPTLASQCQSQPTMTGVLPLPLPSLPIASDTAQQSTSSPLSVTNCARSSLSAMTSTSHCAIGEQCHGDQPRPHRQSTS